MLQEFYTQLLGIVKHWVKEYQLFLKSWGPYLYVFKQVVIGSWLFWVFLRFAIVPDFDWNHYSYWGWLGHCWTLTNPLIRDLYLGLGVSAAYFEGFQEYKQNIEEPLLDWVEEYGYYSTRWMYVFFFVTFSKSIGSIDWYLYSTFGICYEVYYIFFTDTGRASLFVNIENYFGAFYADISEYSSREALNAIELELDEKYVANGRYFGDKSFVSLFKSYFIEKYFLMYEDLLVDHTYAQLPVFYLYSVAFFVKLVNYTLLILTPFSYLIDCLFCVGFQFYFLLMGSYVGQFFFYYFSSSFFASGISLWFIVDLFLLFEKFSFIILSIFCIIIVSVTVFISPFMVTIVSLEGISVSFIIFLLKTYRLFKGKFRVLKDAVFICCDLFYLYSIALVAVVVYVHRFKMDPNYIYFVLGRRKAIKPTIKEVYNKFYTAISLPNLGIAVSIFSPFLFIISLVSSLFLTGIFFEILFLDSVFGAQEYLWGWSRKPNIGIGALGSDWGNANFSFKLPYVNHTLAFTGPIEADLVKYYSKRFRAGQVRSGSAIEGLLENMNDELPEAVVVYREAMTIAKEDIAHLPVLTKSDMDLMDETFTYATHSSPGDEYSSDVALVASSREDTLWWEWKSRFFAPFFGVDLNKSSGLVDFLPHGHRRDIQFIFLYILFWGLFLSYVLNNISFYHSFSFFDYGRHYSLCAMSVAFGFFLLIFDRFLMELLETDEFLPFYYTFMTGQLISFILGGDFDNELGDCLNVGLGSHTDFYRTGNHYANGARYGSLECFHMRYDPSLFVFGSPSDFLTGYSLVEYLQQASHLKLNFLPTYFSARAYEMVPKGGFGVRSVNYNNVNILELSAVLEKLVTKDVTFFDLLESYMIKSKRSGFIESYYSEVFADYRLEARKELISKFVDKNPGWTSEEDTIAQHFEKLVGPNRSAGYYGSTGAKKLTDGDLLPIVMAYRQAALKNLSDIKEAHIKYYGATNWEDFEYLHYSAVKGMSERFGRRFPHHLYKLFAEGMEEANSDRYTGIYETILGRASHMPQFIRNKNSFRFSLYRLEILKDYLGLDYRPPEITWYKALLIEPELRAPVLPAPNPNIAPAILYAVKKYQTLSVTLNKPTFWVDHLDFGEAEKERGVPREEWSKHVWNPERSAEWAVDNLKRLPLMYFNYTTNHRNLIFVERDLQDYFKYSR